MSDLGVNSSLLVASLDLKMVQDVLQAIRTADLTGAAERAGSSSPASSAGAVNRAGVQTVFETRYVRGSEKPAATFEPCRVPHWHPRLSNLQPYTCTRPVLATEGKAAVQPPWKVLPWPKTERTNCGENHLRIKNPTGRVDTDHIGRTLDLFV